MLTTKELQEVKEYVLHEMPQALEHDPQFIRFIENIISKKAVRRDEWDVLLREIKQFREDFEYHSDRTEQKFTDIDKRFEQVDKRFEQVDKRFEQVDKRLDTLDQDIRTARADLTQKIDDLRADLTGQMSDLRDWVEIVVGGFQNRAGKNLENVVAGALRIGLERPDISEEHIRLRQKLVDVNGDIFKPGKQKEVDIIAHNGEWLVFEIKSTPDMDDVDEFADKVALVRLQHPDKQVSGVFITLVQDEDVREECLRRGLRFIPEKQPAARKRPARRA